MLHLMSLFGALLVFILAFAATAISWPKLVGHFHLLQPTPRSIIETRRLGLA